ncbi:hypothetical protein [Spirulina sp. 06S082]|uniref:hypothetical protein n=1 Tax=Spirulina sp. 06S082 TaxID=3110248 RepID=UPI002B1F79E7|nr:hypothetical protein [Spirulina sp. 06S082]MEA5472426.1 hypothetical protein [Spirulina sp. 06S082]
MAKSESNQMRLQRIVLNSTDILPEHVIEYLDQIANSNDRDRQMDILKENFRPLCEFIPKEFVDFALEISIDKPVKRHEPPEFSDRERKELAEQLTIDENEVDLFFSEIVVEDEEEEEFPNDWGIQYNSKFFPPAHVQPPFFYLLNIQEDEGLRLITTLANTAVEKWRKRELHPNTGHGTRTPLPIKIKWHSKILEFWGDADVYRWYRATSVGPNLVLSALMALEYWMEQQIEEGRDAEELFEKIILNNQCVAILGICISLTLAYPKKCLKAALPIISSPAVWHIDIERYIHDQTSSHKFFGDENDWISKMIDERNQKIQRSREIRYLAFHYLFSGNDELRIAFEENIVNFTNNLPFRYQEDRKNPAIVTELQERMKNYQIFGRRENYHLGQFGEEQIPFVKIPEEIRESNELKLAPINQYNQYIRIVMWSQKTIEERKINGEITREQAVKEAKIMQTSNDFTGLYNNFNQFEMLRHSAIAGVATAILVLDFEWVETENLVIWSRDILLAAARLPWHRDEYQLFPFDFKAYVGQGLSILLAHNIEDIEIREELLNLICDAHHQTTQAIFRSLREIWKNNKLFCWNALCLGLSLCCIPQTFLLSIEDNNTQISEWIDGLRSKSLNNIDAKIFPQLPKISLHREQGEQVIFAFDLAECILCNLPLSQLTKNSQNKDQILVLIDELMVHTIQHNVSSARDSYKTTNFLGFNRWDRFFIQWTAKLAQYISLDEIHQHLLTPIQENFVNAPHLTASFLNGYISYHIAYYEGVKQDSQIIWNEICNWVLENSEIQQLAKSKTMTLDFGDILQLILFSRDGKARIKKDWTYINLFVELIDKWVRVVGHNPSAYSHLVAMLDRLGWEFVPDPALKWLTDCVNSSAYNLLTERSNGEQTARLLNRMWNEKEREIRINQVNLQQFSNLIDRLVEIGIPLASTLQTKLET